MENFFLKKSSWSFQVTSLVCVFRAKIDSSEISQRWKLMPMFCTFLSRQQLWHDVFFKNLVKLTPKLLMVFSKKVVVYTLTCFVSL